MAMSTDPDRFLGEQRGEPEAPRAQPPVDSALVSPDVSPANDGDTAVSDVTHPLPTPKADDCLMIIYGPDDTRRRFRIERELLIGREADCDIVLSAESVSRKHARVERTSTGFVVSDLGSRNGTLLNDLLLRGSYGLTHGDVIRVGQTLLKFFCGANVEGAFQEEIYRLTIIDPLTDLPNKRSLLEDLNREFARARRYNRSVSVLILDIDHFKKINDTYGHLVGDDVLRHVASTLCTCLREGDMPARFGGEEFVVLLPESTLVDAIQAAERIRSTVENTVIVVNGEPVPATVSVGCAVIEPADARPESWLARADDKLYQAKHDGRNRVRS